MEKEKNIFSKAYHTKKEALIAEREFIASIGNYTEDINMTFKEFLQWIIEHKEYAPLYSSLISSLALIFSCVSFFISNKISKKRAEKDKAVSDARYEEQKKQYEERLNQERIQREEDKQEMQEINRIREEPYLVFKKSEISLFI